MKGGVILERLQPLGRALMLPIAVLPVAALLLRLGQPDMLDIGFLAAAGQAIFANLGLLFAAGVAVGLARENHGAAGLAGIVCFLVATEGAKPLLVLPPDALAGATDATRAVLDAGWRAKEIAKLAVPAGILSGLVAGWLYNRYSNIRLPSYLGFFAGRRFVPIMAGLAGIALAAAFGRGFPLFEQAVDGLSQWVIASGPIGLFVYGAANRLLLVTGLHHILNNVVWFLLGDFHGATGDLNRFFAGDPSAGAFMSGFFPVMMFGLPAAAFAMYRAAPPGRRRGVAGLYASLALTAFLTGVTEPIEFTFLFLAPALFVAHALLTGAAMVLMDALGVKLGFGFSAGLLDYLLNFGLATRPLLLLPVGLAYAALYFAVFSWGIRRFDLKVPGRDPELVAAAGPAESDRAAAFVAALGGAANLVEVDACTTRLRLVVADPAAIDKAHLSALGARGTLELGAGRLQVVVGPEADQLASEIRPLARRSGGTAAPQPVATPSTGLSEEEAALVRSLIDAGVTTVQARGRRLVTPGAIALPVNHPLVRTVIAVGDHTHILLHHPAEPIARTIEAQLTAR